MKNPIVRFLVLISPVLVAAYFIGHAAGAAVGNVLRPEEPDAAPCPQCILVNNGGQ